MTDRHLFRGKRVVNREWITGSLLQRGDWFLILPDAGYDNINDYHKVDPATIGRCAGYKDRNGKLVFEGDILFDGQKRYIVKYSETSTGMFAVAADGDGVYSLYHLAVQYRKAYVIGNVWDNPELLTQED